MGSVRNRNCSGFTFVEAMTVAVIVAVLAAVAIPVYSNYVTNQRTLAAQSLAQTAATAANAYYRRNGTDPTDSAQLNLFIPNPAQFSLDLSGTSVIVQEKSGSATVSVTLPFR